MAGNGYKIVSFVGGGIRGLMSATILNRLWEHRPSILTDTDLFAGTSTGSVIVGDLLAGKTPPEIIDSYMGSMVGFYGNQKTDPDAPAYSIDEAYAAQVALHGDARLSDKPQKAVMTSFNIGSASVQDDVVTPQPWQPLLYSNLPTLFGGGEDVLVAKAVMSSGAMPGQFGALEGNVDGAFLNHDPTLAVIAVAMHNDVAIEDIVVINIGTGFMESWIAADAHDWGAQQWLDGNDNPFTSAPPFYINLDGPTPSLDMALSGTSTEAYPLIAQMMLGARYTNLNPKLPCFIPENSTSEQDLALLQDRGEEIDISAAIQLLDDYWPVDTVAQEQPA